jgi:hypothetical protein
MKNLWPMAAALLLAACASGQRSDDAAIVEPVRATATPTITVSGSVEVGVRKSGADGPYGSR